MSQSSLLVDLGERLNLAGAAILSTGYTYGAIANGGAESVALKGLVTFVNGAAPSITVTVESDVESGYGFSAVTTRREDRVAPGGAVEHVFAAADGTTQPFWLHVTGLAGAKRWRVGAKSAGASVAGDLVKLHGFGSVV